MPKDLTPDRSCSLHRLRARGDRIALTELCLLAVLLALAGCGGGDDEDLATKSTDPVICAATPALCR